MKKNSTAKFNDNENSNKKTRDPLSILIDQWNVKLINIQNITGVEELLKTVNGYLAKPDLPAENIRPIKNFREHVYRKRKHFNQVVANEQKITQSREKNLSASLIEAQTHIKNATIERASKEVGNSSKSCDIGKLIKTHDNNIEKSRFLQQMTEILNNINYKILFKKTSLFILLFVCSLTLMGGLWVQMIPLYESLGLPYAKYCAPLIILVIIVFASVHTITKSKIALLLCLFISSYEIHLIVVGTKVDESIKTQMQIEKDPDLKLLSMQSTYSEKIYKETQAKYDREGAKTYKNSWYKKNYVEPAWDKYLQDSIKLNAKRAQLNKNISTWDKQGLITIEYRLAILLGFMIVLHFLVKMFVPVEKRKGSSVFRILLLVLRWPGFLLKGLYKILSVTQSKKVLLEQDKFLQKEIIDNSLIWRNNICYVGVQNWIKKKNHEKLNE